MGIRVPKQYSQATITFEGGIYEIYLKAASESNQSWCPEGILEQE